MHSLENISARAPLALLALGCALSAFGAAGCRAAPARDPLAEEIARWSADLKGAPSGVPSVEQIRRDSEPVLDRAAEALRDGRRLLAMQRLAGARTNLAAAVWLKPFPMSRLQDAVALETEWARMGSVLRADLRPVGAPLDGVRPAAVRALGEAALPQVRAYYEASLEYGRSTQPEYGFFYLASAQAQRELVALCRQLARPTPLKAPPVRRLAPELDGLERELLAAYRPPASIDRHPEFILASSILKEGRELDAAGLRYGALLRYLQAAQRVASLHSPTLQPKSPTLTGTALAERLRQLDRQLAAGGIDHSLGRMFLEAAQADLADADAKKTAPTLAPLVATTVLPRYFAALKPAGPAPPPLQAQTTVTLIRWPYT